jgi:UDP-4-amino-4-deoxy-L-arabinose formyltransferase/UDP-glucuronic acid dehydrogenase (UDP-4-keto-hexauronic acid decarboxylating)
LNQAPAFSRAVLFGDSLGIPQLLAAVPEALPAGIVAAGARPQYHDELRALAADRGVRFLIQPAYEPAGVEYRDFTRAIADGGFDLLLCNSYSMIVRPDVLELVAGAAYNVHWSLLPLNRGPNPTQWAIIKGERSTGVTIHHMDVGVDSGAIVAQAEEPISETDTWVSVNERLRALALGLLSEAVPMILSGSVEVREQDHSLATVNPRLTADYPRIDFAAMSDRDIFDLIRAQVAPLPGAFVEREGEQMHFDRLHTMEEVAELRSRYGG